MVREAVDAIPLPDGRARLARAVGWMLLFALLHAAFRYLARRGLLVAARRVEMRLRRDLFSHVIRLPYPFFLGTPTGDVMSRLTNDLSAVWLFLGPGVLTLTGTAISYLLALAFMTRISVPLTGAALVLAPGVVLLSREYGRAFHRLHRNVQESLSAMNAAIQESVSGIRLVKAYGLEERESARFGAECDRYYRESVSVSRAQAAFHGSIGLLSGAGVAVVLLLGGWLVMRGRLTVGGFVAFNAYLAMLAFPTMALGWVINLFQRGESAMGRIREFLEQEAERAQPRGAAPPGTEDPSAPVLEARDLTFSYGEGVRGEALRGVSFAVRRGEVVGIVGRTGCGKSTLLNLLLGFHDPPPGTLFLGGRDLSSIPLPRLRRSVRLVAQDPFLFSDTLLENIGYGAPAEDEEEARNAARAARFLEEIDELPGGIRSVVGERGISLSGGQKQRATIARALRAGGEVLLLDDALSSVDAETEREIFAQILALRPAWTVLFSTHRMAALSRCDRILVLEEGRVAEEGTHDDLFSRGGLYRALYSRQMLARELEQAP